VINRLLSSDNVFFDNKMIMVMYGLFGTADEITSY
jgi:hypothetical protein